MRYSLGKVFDVFKIRLRGEQMKKIHVIGLLVIPALAFLLTGCYTRYDDRYSDNYNDRDYRNGNSYQESDDNYSDTGKSYSDDQQTIVNNYYDDSPYTPSYRRFFLGYHPYISIGYYNDFYDPFYWNSYYWSSYYDWPWCGTYYPGWAWYPRYDNYCYYYPGGGYHHHGWDNAYRDNGGRRRDNNTAGIRNTAGLRGTSTRGDVRRDRTATINSTDRNRLGITRDRGTDRIGSLTREQRTASATRLRSDSRNVTRTTTASGWSRESSRGTVGRDVSRTGATDSRTGATDSRTGVRSRNDGASSVGRSDNTATRNRTGVTNQGETRGRTSERTVQRESNSDRNRDTKVDRQPKNYMREYQQQTREQKRENNLLQRNTKKEERKLYSTPRSSGESRQSASPSRQSASPSRGSSRSGQYSAPQRSSAPSSAPARSNSNPPSRGNNSSESRRSR